MATTTAELEAAYAEAFTSREEAPHEFAAAAVALLNRLYQDREAVVRERLQIRDAVEARLVLDRECGLEAEAANSIESHVTDSGEVIGTCERELFLRRGSVTSKLR